MTDEQKQIRQSLKTIERAQYLKASPKADLITRAEALGADLEGAKTKDDIYDAMIAVANLPDPSLRGRSIVDGPVSFVWYWLDARREEVSTKQLRRKDAVAMLQKEGVAYHTARTQFQVWFSTTNHGTRAVDELTGDDLPKSMR